MRRTSVPLEEYQRRGSGVELPAVWEMTLVSTHEKVQTLMSFQPSVFKLTSTMNINPETPLMILEQFTRAPAPYVRLLHPAPESLAKLSSL